MMRRKRKRRNRRSVLRKKKMKTTHLKKTGMQRNQMTNKKKKKRKRRTPIPMHPNLTLKIQKNKTNKRKKKTWKARRATMMIQTMKIMPNPSRQAVAVPRNPQRNPLPRRPARSKSSPNHPRSARQTPPPVLSVHA